MFNYCYMLNTILGTWIHQWTKQTKISLKHILAAEERQQKLTNECTRCRVGSKISYFSDYKTHPPKKIWEENGGASYSPNVAYLACGGWGEVGGSGVGFFFLFSSSKT